MLRRTALACTAALLALAACGDDDSDTGPPTSDPSAVEADGAPGENDDDGDDGGTGGDPAPTGASAAGGTARLELEDEEGINFRLGTSATAQCTVSEGSVTVQGLEAADGSAVSAVLQGTATEIWEATLRGPDGNRVWFTGNTGDAEGLEVVHSVIDNVFVIDGEWARADDPSEVTGGRLVITCP